MTQKRRESAHQEHRNWDRAKADEADREERAYRDYQKARDWERIRADERERRRQDYRYAGRSYTSDTGPLGRELEYMGDSLIKANTRLIVGVAEVIGNLLLNINDSLWGAPMGTSGSRRANEPAQHFRDSEQYGPADNLSTRAGDVVSNISDDVLHAVRDAGEVFYRSADDVARAYDEELERDRGGNRSANPPKAPESQKWADAHPPEPNKSTKPPDA